MTVSDVHAEAWKAIPGFSKYEASDRGRIRSRATGVLKPRPNNRGYLIVNLTDDNMERRTRTVHSLVLRAHAGEPGPGQEACHGPGGQQDNRWPENLRWDTKEANRDDWREDNPPKPRPVKECVRCGGGFTGNGRRCHECVVEIGVQAAGLLRGGVPLERAAEQMEYPSVSGLHTLAVKYGGYGQSRSRKVRKRLAAWLAGGDAQ